MEHPVVRAIRESGLGSAASLARELGVSRPAVDQWQEEGRRVPAKHCPAIERLCNGAVKCEELNDQVDWAYVRQAGVTSDQAAA